MADINVVSYLASKGYRGRQANGPEVLYPCMFDCGESPQSNKRKLYVNTETGLFTCFVCGSSGGTYLLQKHFGDEPQKPEPGTDPNTRRKILNWAAEVGSVMLSNNDDILMYLMEERGLSPETIVEAKLGFVGNRWSLAHSLPEEFTPKELANTGLVYKDGPKAGRDFFYSHLLIPYLSRGNVVQIRGRQWGTQGGGKYLTGPGEPVLLFGADDLDGAEDAIITEGEFDRLVLKQHLSTAPDDRARRIAVVGLAGAMGFKEGFEAYFANVKRVYLGLDPDDTGKREAVKLKDRLGTRARILELPSELPKADWSDFLLPIPAGADENWRAEHPHAGHTWRDVMSMLGNAAGKRLFSAREAGFSYRQQRTDIPGLKTGYQEVDGAILPGLLPGQVVVILAKTGCIQGDAEIRVNRGGKGFGIKLRDLVDRWEGKRYAWDHNIPTYVQREVDGQVRLGRLVNAWRSGIKTTYTVKTHTGRTIRATDEHPFLTERGWLRLDQLEIGDLVHVRGSRSAAGRKPKVTYAKRTVRQHPYAGRRNVKAGGHSVPLHRLVAEAQMNGVELDTFIQHLNHPGYGHVTPSYRFLDPREWAVHHIDHDPSNNDPANLKICTHSDHAALHAAEGTARNVGLSITTERVVSVEHYGEEETYDLEVADDPHNFMANGLVVHNTGKTVFLCNLAWNMRQHPLLFVSLEMTKEEVYERLRRIAHFFHPRWSDDQVEAALVNILICDENRLSEKDLETLVDEFEVETGQRPQVAFIDYLGYYARGVKGVGQYEKTTNAIMQLKAMAKAGRLTLFSPSQVNRGAVEGKPIDLDDARDSGAIEETADFVISIFRPDEGLNPGDENTAKQPSGTIRATLLKSRHGNKGKAFSFVFDALHLAIVEASSREATRARENNNLAWRSWTYEDLRKQELRPIQAAMFGTPRKDLM